MHGRPSNACGGKMRYSPFASGMLDVRRRSLAQLVAGCAFAEDFIVRTSRAAPGGTRHSMCTGTDGDSIATILEHCVVHNGDGVLRLAHMTDARFVIDSHCHNCSRCGRGTVVTHHGVRALKLQQSDAGFKDGAAYWHLAWAAMTSRPYVPAPLPEFEFRAKEKSPYRRRLNLTTVLFSGGNRPHVFDSFWRKPASAIGPCGTRSDQSQKQ